MVPHQTFGRVPFVARPRGPRDMDQIEQLQNRLVELSAEAADIQAKAAAEKRDLTVEEGLQIDNIWDAFGKIQKDIARLQSVASMSDIIATGQGRQTEATGPTSRPSPDDDDDDPAPSRTLAPRQGVARVGSLTPAPRPKNGGFRSLGEMGVAVVQAAYNSRAGNGTMDPRLHHLAAPSTYGNEASGADGGFAVPQDFRTEIMTKVMGEDSILSRCDQVTVSGNQFTFPVDENAPWGTSGIQAYWDGEAAVATQSKPALTEKTLKLNKIRALVPMTEELLQDASGMDAYLRRKAPEVITMKVNVAIIQGNGVGMPLGIINAPGTVSVAAESPQTADTLISLNVLKMYNRMYGPCRSRAVWFINQDVEPWLYRLSMPGVDNAGNSVSGWGTHVYMPAGGLSGQQYGTLFGRPVIPTQACETVGDVGDIIFADMSQYLAVLKSGPNPRVETSMHFWFDQDLMAFKFILRVGGMPWWGSAISARDGSNTYSAFVTLAAR